MVHTKNILSGDNYQIINCNIYIYIYIWHSQYNQSYSFIYVQNIQLVRVINTDKDGASNQTHWYKYK